MANAIPLSRNSPDAIRTALRQQATRSKTPEFDASGKQLDPLEMFKTKLHYFVPGSSLRGSWRSHLETILRSVHGEEAARVCDPLSEEGSWKSCSKDLEDGRKRVTTPYQHSCPICRLFGSTEHGGRIWIGDGQTVAPPRVSIRDHVAIDRKTGGPSPNKLFREMTLEGLRFTVEVRVKNFELFHVYLVALLVDEIRRGAVAIGSGKSRGYGRNVLNTRDHKNSLVLSLVRRGTPGENWEGLAEHPDHGPRYEAQYKMRKWSKAPQYGEGNWTRPTTPWRHERKLSLDALASFQKQCDAAWADAELDWYGLLKDRVPLPPEPTAAEAQA